MLNAVLYENYLQLKINASAFQTSKLIMLDLLKNSWKVHYFYSIFVSFPKWSTLNTHLNAG